MAKSQIKPLPSTPPKISLVLPEVARSSTEHCQRQVSVQSSSADRREKTLHTLRGAKSLAAITFMFSVCWLPHTYFQFRTYLDPAYVHSTEWGAANWLVFLGMSNSIMNPFIYAWQRRDFNTACRRLFARGVQIE
ncbi:adenosine receptor A2b-like [Dreissena polymorpha]|uniref:adenosine receptor A2b-like n=1 Tax=Dreissena polymorpha TaxID=45954 RepID=UPI00226557E8|nr:adenosine receptor A2b-like [Dreissena polymorpha]